MIATSSIVCMCIAFFLSTILPLAFLIIWVKKFSGTFKYALFGALAFIVTQMVIRIPLMTLTGFQQTLTNLHIVVGTLIMALTAGLFEGIGRLVVIKCFMKQKKDYPSFFACGLGHGTIVAILLVGATYISYIAFALLINTQGIESVLNIVGDATMENTILATLQSPGYTFLLGGFERIFTVGLQTFLTTLMAYFILANRTGLGFFLVCLLHTAVDFIIPLLYQISGDVFLAECVMSIIFGLSLYGLVMLKRNFDILNNQQEEVKNIEENN